MFNELAIRKILNNYPIDQNLSIIPINNNQSSNKVWKIGNDYYLKMQSKSRIIKELQLAKQLNQQGFMAITPIKTNDNKEYLELDTTFLLTYNLLSTIQDSNEWWNHSDYVYQCGKSIAKLHNALLNMTLDDFIDNQVYQNVSNWAIPTIKKSKYTLPEQLVNDYKSFEKLFDLLPKQLIHRDLHPGNILFQDNKMIGFIDFELSEQNTRLFDVCYLATGVLASAEGINNYFKQWLTVLDNIIAGYNSINPLTVEEKESIYYIICSIQLIFIAYFSSNSDYEDLVKKNLDILNCVVENKKHIKELIKRHY